MRIYTGFGLPTCRKMTLCGLPLSHGTQCPVFLRLLDHIIRREGDLSGMRLAPGLGAAIFYGVIDRS
jgi:hypothetical protein